MAKKPTAKKKMERGIRRFDFIKGNGDGKAAARIAMNRQELITHAMMQRSQFFKSVLEADGKDINAECGYPDSVGAGDYHRMYEREGIAARVVEVLPQESWISECLVYESEDTDDETEFEKAWNKLAKDLNIYSELQKLDEISGIGRYGVMLLGFNDGAELKEEVSQTEDMELLFVRVFEEIQCEISSVEPDTENPRFGEPTEYLINVADSDEDPAFKEMLRELGASTNDGVKVHWSRVIHLASADHSQRDKVLGVPRMQQVYNRLCDLRKVLGGSAEMFWKGGFPGYAFSIDGDVDPDSIDEEAMREEYEAYQLGLQRYLAMLGVTVTSLSTQVADPSSQINAALENIAISKGIPVRIFKGSERGELASSQDEIAHSKRMKRRQEQHITPHIVRPFVDRMMEAGVLPEVEEYEVWWESIYEPSDAERAGVAMQQVQAMSAYVSAGIDTTLIAPTEFLVDIMGFDLELVERWLEAVEEHVKEVEAKALEDAERQGEMQAAQAEAAGVPVPGSVPPAGAPPAKEDDEEEAPPKKKPTKNVWTDEAREKSLEARRAGGKRPDPNAMLMAGTKVHFTDGEHKGMTGTIQSQIPKRYAKSETTYRIQIDGYPKPGGWNGKIFATAKNLSEMSILVNVSNAWTQAAREASLEARRAAGKSKSIEVERPAMSEMIETFDKSYAEVVSITIDEDDVIQDFKLEGHKPINAAVREPHNASKEDLQKVALMDSYIAKNTGKISEVGPIYRGKQVTKEEWDKIEVGGDYGFKAYASMSIDPVVATSFIRRTGENGVLFRVKSSRMVPLVANLNTMEEVGQELEYINPRGSRYRVTGKDIGNVEGRDHLLVDLELI